MAVTNSYADVEHVQPYLTPYGLTIGGSSVPTATQVEGFLDQVAAEVDAVLKARGYATVPATDATDILFLRLHVSMYAAVLTYAAGFGSDDMPDGIEEMKEHYHEFLKRIADGDLTLPGQSQVKRPGVMLPQRYTED
jgi:hypothetical protein